MNIATLIVFVFISAYVFTNSLVATVTYNEQYSLIYPLIPLLCAAAVVWFTWSCIATTSNRKELASSISSWAWAVGIIGFVAGYFGPLTFQPDANLGPLLGFMYTGPGGFLLGGIGRFVYWRNHQKENSI